MLAYSAAAVNRRKKRGERSGFFLVLTSRSSCALAPSRRNQTGNEATCLRLPPPLLRPMTCSLRVDPASQEEGNKEHVLNKSAWMPYKTERRRPCDAKSSLGYSGLEPGRWLVITCRFCAWLGFLLLGVHFFCEQEQQKKMSSSGSQRTKKWTTHAHISVLPVLYLAQPKERTQRYWLTDRNK